jgi:hypothetical protein
MPIHEGMAAASYVRWQPLKMKTLIYVWISLLVIVSAKGQSTEPESPSVAFEKNKHWIQSLIPLGQEQQLDSIRGRILQNYHKKDFDNRSPVFVIEGYLPQFSSQTDSLEIYTLLSFLTSKQVDL